MVRPFKTARTPLFLILFSLCFFLPSIPTAHADLSTGLVGWWKFDEQSGNAIDSGPNGLTGTPTGTALVSSGCAKFRCRRFAGGTNAVDVTNNDSLFGSNSAKALSLWFKKDTLSPALPVPRILEQYTDTSNYFELAAPSAGQAYGSGAINFTVNVGGTVVTKATPDSSVLSTTNWYHVVVVWNGASITAIYLNGVSQTLSTPTALGTGSVAGLHLGNGQSSGRPFQGLLDDVRIYNRPLSAVEVMQLYKQGTVFAASPVNAFTSGLVGYWTFDGKDTNWATGRTNDSSGQGNTGQLISMSTTTSPVIGKIGQGFTFDGVNDYVNVGTLGNFGANMDTTGATFATWIKTTSTATAGLMGSANNGNISVLQIDLNRNFTGGVQATGYIYARIRDEDNVRRVLQAGQDNRFTDGKWHFLVVVFRTSSQGNIYLDGVNLAASELESGNVTNTANFAFPLTLGALNWKGSIGTDGWYNGSMDDSRLYNRALSASEVAQLYKQGAAKFAVSSVQSLTNGLVGYWTFDGKNTNWGTGIVQDLSGQGNNGSLISMSTTTSPVMGKIGQGMKFDGVNDYVTAASTGIGSLTTEITSAFWLKTTKESIPGQTTEMVRNDLHFTPLQIASTGGTGNGTAIQSRCVRRSGGANGLFYFDWNGVFNDGKWHHYACSYSSTAGFRVYKDGVLHASSGAFVGDMPTTANPVCFGAQCDGTPAGYTDTALDDVRFYNRVLSASEVTQLYKLGSSISR